MTPTTLNSHCFSRAWQAAIALLLFVAINAQAAPVAEDVVRRVAQNYIANHIANFGNWNGGLMAEIESVELVRYENTLVAYSVAVRPSGYLLMAYDDDFSPVLLYSDRGSFLPSRVAEFGSAESWIIPETHAVKANIASRRSELKSMLQESAVEQTKLNSKSWQAWMYFDKSVAEFSKAANEQRKSGVVSGSATAGPFLTTAWDQGESLAPFTYNLYTPMDPGSGNKLGCLGTVTGCVATATAQIMRYWSWPDSGQGSSRYTWQPKSGASAVELSANYARVYDWASMPDSLTSTSLSAQIDAVARLMRDVGVSAEMRYGCAADGSGASAAKAASSLASFFKYKSSIRTVSRDALSASEFFAVLKLELDASPPRPVLFTMFHPKADGQEDVPGHAVVIDGYQTGVADMAHINMGWSGAQTAYYDISNNWTTGSFLGFGGKIWDATTQVAYTGIEPNRCQKILSQTSRTVLATSQSGTVDVSTPTQCPWTVSSNASWITLLSSTSASGSATVSYLVGNNTSTSARTGTMTIAGQTFTIIQPGISCSYSLSPTSNAFATASASTATIALTTAAACEWFANSDVDWLSVSTASRGKGSASIGYAIAANDTDAPRTATLNIADKTFTVTQPANCAYSIAPSTRSLSAAAATGTVSVTAGGSCAWTAASNAAWVTLTYGSSGSGYGTVGFSVAANTGTSTRTGTVTIAQQTFTVTQTGAGVSSTSLLNPGFEDGPVNWTQTGQQIISYNGSRSHSGFWVAWLAGYDNAVNTLAQEFTIPASTQSPSIRFWYNITTAETTTTTAYDTMSVDIYSVATGTKLATLATFSNLNKTSGWTQSPAYDVSALKGQNIRLVFSAVSNSTNVTSFFVDDVLFGSAAGISSIASGAEHSCAVINSEVQCWGNSNYGQLGNGALGSGVFLPVTTVGIGAQGAFVAAGERHSCAVVNAGVKCWGGNSVGQLGNNLALDSAVPVEAIVSGGGATAIAAGAFHSCAVVSGGAQCWGQNTSAQLGNILAPESHSPVVAIAANSAVTDVAAGARHTCVVIRGGVKCWGSNIFGGLGSADPANAAGSVTPVDAIPAFSNVSKVTTGSYHSCALLDGGVKCWGFNERGQLGVSNLILYTSDVPIVTVAANSGVTGIAAGSQRSCAVIYGGVKCWGAGPLGDGTTNDSASPVAVMPSGSGVTAVSVSSGYACAITNADVFCWGLNRDGQFTGGLSTLVPVRVVGFLSGLPTVPGSPVIGAANGGNGLATVNFAPPAQNGGSTIASYLVTASPGGRTAASTASPITVPGLTNGTAYTFTVTATNSVGTSAPSAPSNSVTPAATVPGAPTIGTATTGNALAVVRFTPPASNGGSAITNYTVTSTPGNFTGSGAGSPIAVPGLTNGTAYTFVVRASNAAGTGPASASSNSVTPTVTVASAPVIGSVTLSGAQATVSFTAPPSNGGSAILTYTATCGSQSVTGTGSPLIVAGLTAGTTVFCSVSATNAVGTSAASAIGISAAPPPASCASINGPGLISIPATASTQTYNATCNNTAAYVWKLDGATLGCATSSCAIVFAASALPVTTTHTVTVAPSTATASVASLTVTQAAAAVAPVCSGIIGPVSLSAIGGPYTYSANCVGATDYLWYLANSNFSNTDCTSGGIGTPTCRYLFNFNTGTAPVSYVIKVTARNAVGIAPQQSVTVTMAAPPASCSLDFNGDGAVNTTDALLFSRWLSGFRNASLVSGITPYPAGTTAANFATAVTNRMVLGQVHDFDDNGAVDAATDGLLLLRLTQGLTGGAVTSGAVGLGSHRASHDLIRTYVNTSCGTNFAAGALPAITLAKLSEYKYGDVWRDGNTTWAMAAKVVNANDYFTRPDGARAVRHQLFLLALNGGTLRETTLGEAYLQDNTFSQSAVWVQATNGNIIEFFWNEKRANDVYEMAGVRGIFSKLTNTVTSRADNFVDQNMGWYPWLAADGLHHFNYSGFTEMLDNATGNVTTPATFIGQWNAQRTTHTGGVLPAPTDADVASRLCALHCVP